MKLLALLSSLARHAPTAWRPDAMARRRQPPWRSSAWRILRPPPCADWVALEVDPRHASLGHLQICKGASVPLQTRSLFLITRKIRHQYLDTTGAIAPQLNR